MKQESVIVKDLSTLSCSVDSRLIEFIKSVDGDLLQNNMVYGSVGSSVYELKNGQLNMVLQFNSYVKDIIPAHFGIILLCSNGAWISNLKDGRIASFDKPIYAMFASGVGYYCANKNELYHVEIPAFSNFHIKNEHMDLKYMEKAVYLDEKQSVKGCHLKDMQTFVLELNNGYKQTYKESVMSSFVTLQPNLFCISLVDISSNHSQLILISISKNKLVKLYSTHLDDVVLQICSKQRNIAVVCHKSASLYYLKSNKLYLTKLLRGTTDALLDLYFIDENKIAIILDDYSYKIVDFRTKEVVRKTGNTTVRPFQYKKQIGTIIGSTVYFLDAVVDCGEEVVGFCVKDDELFLFGVHGSIYLLRECELTNEESSLLRRLRTPSIQFVVGCIDLDMLPTLELDAEQSGRIEQLVKRSEE